MSLKKLHFMDPEDPDSDPDHSQNLIISSFYLFRHILKITSKSVHKLLSYLVHKQTNKQKATNPGENITSLTEVIISRTVDCTFIKPDYRMISTLIKYILKCNFYGKSDNPWSTHFVHIYRHLSLTSDKYRVSVQ